MKKERVRNEVRYVYDCKRCGSPVDVWVDCQIPPLVYCDPCALKVIDAWLDKKEKQDE